MTIQAKSATPKRSKSSKSTPKATPKAKPKATPKRKSSQVGKKRKRGSESSEEEDDEDDNDDDFKVRHHEVMIANLYPYATSQLLISF